MSENPSRGHFQSAYEGKPPWDLDGPQEPYIELADQITGSILDAGCGTGENALFFAERGHPVTGIDFVDEAIDQAGQKARERGIQAEFLQMDVLQLTSWDRAFDNVIDCGLFHVLSDEDRLSYVAGLTHVTRLGGRLFLMCFSDREPPGAGPRRISEAELWDVFARGWTFESITAARFEPSADANERDFSEGGPKAWFAVIRREA